MSIRQRLHDLAETVRSFPYRNAQDPFTRLNPTLDGQHAKAVIDRRAAAALDDENDQLEPPKQRRRLIEHRARQARAIAGKREHDRQETFARLNPEFGVLPDSHDPEQHRFAQQRERALALGERVAAAEQSGRERGEPSDSFSVPRLQATPSAAREQLRVEPASQRGVER
jgi:hypothetical protein